MNLQNLTVFQFATRKLDWLGQRQAVLAQNIANADTPSYQARDLEKLTFKETVKRLAPVPQAQTHSGHLVGTRVPPSWRIEKEDERKLYEVAPDGNGVVLEEQLIRVADTQLQHQAATNLMRKQLSFLQMAARHTAE